MSKCSWEGHGTKSTSCSYCALSAHLLRGIHRLFDHLFHNFFVELRSSLHYINAGSYHQLVLDRFNSANDASGGNDSFNTASESRNVVKRNTLTVWKAILYFRYVIFVDKSRTVKQRVHISYKTEMHVTFAAKSAFHAWKAIIQESGLVSLHPLLIFIYLTANVMCSLRFFQSGVMSFIQNVS